MQIVRLGSSTDSPRLGLVDGPRVWSFEAADTSLADLLHLVPEGTTELMCHPGYPSSELESVGGKLASSREAEVLALTAREIKETVESLGIRLTNVRNLEKAVPTSL